MREEFKANDAWYGVLVILALILGWRMFGGKRATRKGITGSSAARLPYPGEDSEFYAVEKALAERAPGETQAAWVKRIASDFSLQELNKINAALQLHQRYRFDPEGISAAERSKLRELCRSFGSPGGAA
jgi:hypothetical protein